jgi:membrane-bound lytic murein transglycosylase A
VTDPRLGPVGAQGVALTPGRSLAIDRAYHTLGTPIWLNGTVPASAIATLPFRRLMVAQDTGSAIKGPARGDIFYGSGDAAGELAGLTRHAADFYVLLPKGLGAARR